VILRRQNCDQEYEESSAVIHNGFVAQEVEQAAKESGFNSDGLHRPTNEKDNYSIAYSQFVVPLIKAAQEQQKLIEDQKQKIDQQQQQIELMLKRIEMLEKKLTDEIFNYEKILFFISIIALTNDLFSQSVGIGTNAPNSSAQLEIKSNTKGILIPRTSSVTRAAIVGPAKSLLLYDTVTNSFWFHNGSDWIESGRIDLRFIILFCFNWQCQ
jgi:hypothetical protein